LSLINFSVDSINSLKTSYERIKKLTALQMDKFFEMVSQFICLSFESRAALSEIALRLALPKGYLLLKPYAVCNHIYFIETGLTRTFYIKDGKDVTDWFSAKTLLPAL